MRSTARLACVRRGETKHSQDTARSDDGSGHERPSAMPALKNAKHERFAQELAKGKSQIEAYTIAGYEPNESHASRLVRNGKVAARLAEIQERGALRAEVSIATLTQDLLRLRDKGEALSDAAGLSVARNSVMDIAKLNGLIVDRATLGVSGQLDITQIELTAG